MKIQATAFTIAEIAGMFERQELVVNRTYQRNPGLWPLNAKSYFIDTILNEFPFPKVYFYEMYDKKLKKVRREIVDGQQRLSTITSFANNDFALTSTSQHYKKKRFSDLDEDAQARFMSYSVPVDNILSAGPSEILEMFRRMNSLTVTLNPAEKRHAEFSGPFKWFVNEMADNYSPMLVQFDVLTQKQALRMADAELLTELVQVCIDGIVNKQDTALRGLYKRNDHEFPLEDEIRSQLIELLDFVGQHLGFLKGTFLFKSYAFYSLCAALVYNRFAPPALNFTAAGLHAMGQFWSGSTICAPRLHALAAAHEGQEVDGPFGDYVKACIATTHRVSQRTVRTTWVIKALNGTLPV